MSVTKGGSRLIRHYNRKLGKSRRKSLSKFLSKRRRNLLKTIKKGYKTITRSGSSKRRGSSKRSMRGGGVIALSPSNIDFANTTNSESTVIADSVQYSLGPAKDGDSSAMANPPTPTRLNGCTK